MKNRNSFVYDARNGFVLGELILIFVAVAAALTTSSSEWGLFNTTAFFGIFNVGTAVLAGFLGFVIGILIGVIRSI